ncbi:XRE family transcriptional regulator [Paraflavitalea soli]|uniref:XRE family transcriptional regulator n=1 Tax=Paraflavitalea soli TaxID=2315862 RepID=A0A3B7MV41_9BACT|nr:helix-turn-helix transcriptional regulator [Paraflavitalea soli]AXY77958.1 XRE family transcriptional regulator [Paraflavitalea soli]
MAERLSKDDAKLKDKIASRLKEIRESTGKNKTEFAYDLGVDKQVVSRLENGRGATIYTIDKYCKVMGITLSDFFDSPLFAEE